MLLWLEYKETYPDGYAYSQFCELFRSWRKRVDVVMRQEHRAGEKLFVDFPGARLPIYDPGSGEVDFEAEVFVAVLGASSYVHAGAVASQQLDDWVLAHVRTFEAIGGCPAIVVCDNLRSGVTRAHRYEPDINATYQDMATHYGVAVIPARSYRPRFKAKSGARRSFRVATGSVGLRDDRDVRLLASGSSGPRNLRPSWLLSLTPAPPGHAPGTFQSLAALQGAPRRSHAKVTKARTDGLHKLTTRLAKAHVVVVVRT